MPCKDQTELIEAMKELDCPKVGRSARREGTQVRICEIMRLRFRGIAITIGQRQVATMNYGFKLLSFGLLASWSTCVFAQDSNFQLGRYQALTGSEIRDKDKGTEDPGVWLLDTATGKLAFCQSGVINLVEIDEGYTIGEPRVSCTPWEFPEPDDDPLGIRDAFE